MNLIMVVDIRVNMSIVLGMIKIVIMLVQIPTWSGEILLIRTTKDKLLGIINMLKIHDINMIPSPHYIHIPYVYYDIILYDYEKYFMVHKVLRSYTDV